MKMNRIIIYIIEKIHWIYLIIILIVNREAYQTKNWTKKMIKMIKNKNLDLLEIILHKSIQKIQRIENTLKIVIIINCKILIFKTEINK